MAGSRFMAAHAYPWCILRWRGAPKAVSKAWRRNDRLTTMRRYGIEVSGKRKGGDRSKWYARGGIAIANEKATRQQGGLFLRENRSGGESAKTFQNQILW